MAKHAPQLNDLINGNEGPRVEELHRMLKKAGFGVDGNPSVFSEKTSDAVRLFQETRKIHISGNCDQRTWDALIEAGYQLGDRFLYLSNPMLRGEDVAELQRAMGSLGFNPGKVDGIFGPDTKTAVELFQRNSGLVVDAIFGNNCLSALKKLGDRREQHSVAILKERERIITKIHNDEHPHVVIGDIGGLSAVVLEITKSLRNRHIEADPIHHYDLAEHATFSNKNGVDLYIGIYPVEETEVSISYYAAKGFESPGGASFTHLLAQLLEPLVAEPIVIHAHSEQILRETRMPAVVIRIGPTNDLVRISPQLPIVLKQAISTWFTTPFDENPS